MQPLFKKWKESKDVSTDGKSTSNITENTSQNTRSGGKLQNVTNKSRSFDRPIGSTFNKNISGSASVTNGKNSNVADKNTSAGDCDKKCDSLKPLTDIPGSSSVSPVKASSSYSVIVNPRQRGNPVLKHIRNIPWEYGEIVPDFALGKSTCALYLSLRYHQTKPDYIHERLKLLGHSYDLRVMLVQVDIKDPHHCLKDLAKICILADCTLILAFSTEEAGRYLETYKVYENKPPEAIMEKTEEDFMSKLIDSFTTVKSVNKTDCITLLSTFGSVKEIMQATQETLSFCPGVGPQKAKRLHTVFNEPFLKSRKGKSPQKDPVRLQSKALTEEPSTSASKDAD